MGVWEQMVLGIGHCVGAVGCLECTTGSKRNKPKKVRSDKGKKRGQYKKNYTLPFKMNPLFK